jgi:hypothetical protein
MIFSLKDGSTKATNCLVNHSKASSTTTRQKVDLIISNREKYSISAMCKLLKVSRSLVYYHLNNRESSYSHEDSKIENI